MLGRDLNWRMHQLSDGQRRLVKIMIGLIQQFNMQYLEKYQKLREENHPSKMVAMADHWMRAELEQNRRSRRDEKLQREIAHSLNPTDHQGGFSIGRNLQTESQPLVRKYRLSDMMGNSGVMENHR